jgi:hypothetical protein
MSSEKLNNLTIDKEYIKGLVQNILDNKHTILQKKIIKSFPDRLNFSCPICMDSEKTISKKRGNLYFKNLRYICFNDSSCSCSFTTFLKKFNIEIELEKKLEIYNYIDNNVVYRNTDNYNVIETLDKLIDLNELIGFINRNPEHKLSHIRKIEHSSVCYDYLRKRRIKEIPNNLYEGIYNYTDKWKDPIIINFNKSSDDKVIGMQIRNLKDGDSSNKFEQRFYKIYDFSQLWNIINPELDLDELEKISYNKLSHFYNIFNVDFERPITIFEGYFDSLFFPNSIGAIGKNTDFGFLLNDTDIDVQFFFDNDKDGFEKSAVYLEKGYKVFLWNKFIDHIVLTKKNKSEALKYMKNIKDLNKLVIESKKDAYRFFKLQEYFSKDTFDKYYL